MTSVDLESRKEGGETCFATIRRRTQPVAFEMAFVAGTVAESYGRELGSIASPVMTSGTNEPWRPTSMRPSNAFRWLQ